MRAVHFIAAAAMAAAQCAFAGGGFSMMGLSYVQRGVLEIGGSQTPVTVFVKSGGGEAAMQMESPVGTLCRVRTGVAGREIASGSAAFRDSWAREHALRALEAAMAMPGFLEGEDGVKISFSPAGGGFFRAHTPSGFRFEMSDFSVETPDGRLAPRLMEVSGPGYGARLKLVKILK